MIKKIKELYHYIMDCRHTEWLYYFCKYGGDFPNNKTEIRICKNCGGKIQKRAKNGYWITMVEKNG